MNANCTPHPHRKSRAASQDSFLIVVFRLAALNLCQGLFRSAATGANFGGNGIIADGSTASRNFRVLLEK